MESFDLWWNEEREACYWSMRVPFIYLTLLSASVELFVCINSPECVCYETALIFWLIGCLLLISVVLTVERYFPRCKYMLGILMCELQTILFVKLANEIYPDQKESLIIGSTVTIAIFEVSLVRQIEFAFVFLVKFMYIWYFRDLISSGKDLGESSTSIITAIYVIASVVMYESRKRQRMFNVYMLKKKYEETCHKLDGFVNAVPDALIVLNDENTVELFNTAAKQIFGCTERNEMLDILIELRYAADRRNYEYGEQSELIYNDIKNYLNNPDITHANFGVVAYNGLHFEIVGNKVLKDRYKAAIFTARDTTAIIQLEETRAESKWKTAMLRSVSHELRTPATGIISFSDQVLESETNLSQENRDKLRMVSVSSNFLLHLINDLLDFTQILAGTFKIHKSYFNLRNLLITCFSLIEMQCKKKNLRTILNIDPLLPENIYSDPNRLTQIILNLLSNALKYTMSGQIKMICYSTVYDTLEVVVKDTGIGIPEHKFKTLFSLFGTFIESPICPQGSGIGLHISNMLVRALGGPGLKVISEPGKGSEFGFSVDILENEPDLSGYEFSIEKEPPNEREEVKHIPALIAGASYDSKDNSVLIVDDNDFVRSALAHFFTNAGVPFNEACTGKQAVEEVIKRNRIGNQYKVIIMDCEMPEMDGWSATREIFTMWETGKISELPVVIAHTAFIGDEETQRCREAGMRETLFKPTSERDMIHTVKKYLRL